MPKMLQVDTCVAVVAAIYLTTRFPYNSTDVIVRENIYY